MGSIWQIFGRGASSPTISEYLHLSKTNIHRISNLTSRESQPEELLNPYQCRSMSSKLVRTLENIAALCYFCDKDSPSATSNTSTLFTTALQNFYLVSQRAKELVESCCSVDWCQASTFQIHNEEAFKEILLETGLCYSTIYEMVKDKAPFQDLRRTSTFDLPTTAEVVRDRIALLQSYQKFVDPSLNSNSNENQKQHLAKHLMRRLSSFMSKSNIEDVDARELSLWPDGKSTGDEWGKDSTFLGRDVFKTTWLDVPCAKKVFDDGMGEEEILAEAKILAYLNHPNIVKFICCGHDSENSWCHFIAMEHMEKGLHSVIRKQAQANKGAPFPLLSAVDIMLQIAYGTCYLHDNGVAHRDLKTCNVVVRQMTTPHLQDYFQVKLIDFGLSKVKLSASKSNTISSPKTGTTVYMAPEAFQRGRANWFKADVYSFGITCSVILSGEEPFPREEFERSKMYEAIRNGARPALPADTPEELACLIKECWDTDRNFRPDFVNICTRLAKLRHKLLRVDPHGHASANEDDTGSLFVQGILRKRSDARKQQLENKIENANLQRFVPNEPTESMILTRSQSSKTSSKFLNPTPMRTSASESFVDKKGRYSISRRLGNAYSMPRPYPTPSVSQAMPNKFYAVEDRIPVSQFQSQFQGAYPEYNMPWTAVESDPRLDEDVYGEEILAWRQTSVYNVAPVDYGHQQYVMPGQVQPSGPRMGPGHSSYRSTHTVQPGQIRSQAPGGFVDSRGRSGMSAPESAHVMSASGHPGMQSGEAEEPTSSGGSTPLWVQPGDLIGLKRQLVQLLHQNGGKMMLSKVPAEYNKLFGRPLYLAEYNAQRLVHLIDKMKDTLVIKGDGTSKTLHLAKKEAGCVTNKYKPSSNRASVPKGDKDKDTSEDSEPESTMPPSKELEKETAKIDFAADLLSKSSLLEVEKDPEKETFVARDSLNKRHLLDMDIDLDMEETIVVQANALSSSDWNRAPVDTVDVLSTNLSNFKHHLQELLIVYSFEIPLKDFVTAYQQRFARTLDLPSFGVGSLEALLDKVKGVAVIKERLDNGVKRFFLVAAESFDLKSNLVITTKCNHRYPASMQPHHCGTPRFPNLESVTKCWETTFFHNWKSY